MSDCSAGWSVGPDLARLPDWRIVPGEPGVMVVTFAEGELPPGEWTVTAGYNDLDLITGTAVADGDALTITFDAEASADLFDDGVLTVPWRLYLDGAWWGGGNIRPASLHDDPGPCGATVVVNPPGSVDPITIVVSRCAEDGDDGREVELRVDGSTLQWRYVGDAAWTNLYDLGDVEVDGQGITVALALASAADLIATEDPLPFRDIDGDAQFPAPLDDIPVGTKVLARDEAPAEQGLWTWDGATWTYDADQPGGSPVFVLLPGPAGPGWFVVSPFDGPGATYRQADTRRDREQLWTAAQTTRLAVPTDGSVVPFGNLEIVDPGDPDEGLSFGGVVVVGLDVPGLGPVVGGGVAVEQWNPFTGAFTGAAGVLVYSFVGVDNTFAPVFRFAIRQRAIGGSLLTSELAPLYVGEPVDPEDAATKRYVDDTLGDTLGNYVTDGDPRLSDARTPTAHAASHATGGSDALTAGDIGAATSGHNHSGVYDPAGTAASAVSALGLGTAATKNVPASGDAGSTEVVKGDDTRLSDARTPAAHNQAASTITSGTLDIARIPTGTTSTTVPLGNDTRFTDARTPTAHAASHAPGGSDVLGVGHFAPDLPGALGLGRRVGANVTVTRGRCMWIPMPLLAVPAKATTIWVKTVTGVASCAMTGAICAAKSASLDAPGTILGSTSVGAMSLASSSAVVGGTLTSPVTLAAGVRYFVQIIALNGASNPTVQGADGLTEGNNWENGSAGPVTPTAQVDTAGIFVWSGRSALEDDPARDSYVTNNTKPFVYVSLEAP